MRYVPPEEIYEVERQSVVWVTLADGTEYEVEEPKIEDSTLVGYVEAEGYKEIEFSEIESLGIKELDKRKTVKLAAIGITGAFVLIWVLSNGESESEPCGT